MFIIKSKENKVIKRYNSLNNKKKRDKLKSYVIEGKRFVDEALKEQVNIKSIIISETFLRKNKNYIDDNSKYCFYIVEDNLLNKISNTDNSQGILAEVYYDNNRFELIKSSNDLILILDRIKDPGNMGTIIRTADAFDVSSIYCLKGCVDVYNPKVLRSTMGSIFRVHISRIDDEFKLITDLKKSGYKLISTCLDGDLLDKSNMKTGKCVFVIGNESEGVKNEIKVKSDVLVKIPINDKVESLNASIATAIMIYNYKINNK